MEQSIGFKELYDVSLKATYPIETNGEVIEIGETIAVFDRISIANFQEIKTVTVARGGKENRGLIWWESTNEVKLSFSQGVFSAKQLALMTNSKMIEAKEEEPISVQKIENLESDRLGLVYLSQSPKEKIFVYNAATGQKIKNWTCDGNTMYVGAPYREVIVDYCFDYKKGGTMLQLGRPFVSGTFSLMGKVKVKDDVTGIVTTGIISIPKLRLMSDLSMRVGSDAIPQVGRLDAVAVPEGGRGQSKVMEIIFLNDDIDADM